MSGSVQQKLAHLFFITLRSRHYFYSHFAKEETGQENSLLEQVGLTSESRLSTPVLYITKAQSMKGGATSTDLGKVKISVWTVGEGVVGSKARYMGRSQILKELECQAKPLGLSYRSWGAKTST